MTDDYHGRHHGRHYAHRYGESGWSPWGGWPRAAVGFFGFIAFTAMFFGLPLAAMLIWNALLPGLFGLPVLGYWQAMGILVLTRILFGRGGRHGFRYPGRRRYPDREAWKRHLRERFSDMGAEDREEAPKNQEPG